MKKPLKDVSASVRQRLLNQARETGRPFDELLQYYSMERFLYRLAQSDYRDKFVLKGALMFIVWKAPRSRATRDIDFLGRGENSIERLVQVVKDVCRIAAPPDGMIFDADTVTGVRIKEDTDYEGVRVTFKGHLGQARTAMQIDVGFGDAVNPKPQTIDYPVILDMPAPRLKGYPRETVVAEKFQAMVQLGLINTRMKDYYDLWLLARQFDFEGTSLGAALRGTFARRKTDLALDPVALSGSFASDSQKKAQWTAFRGRTRLEHIPEDIGEVIAALKDFLLPITTACIGGNPAGLVWKAPGPWRDMGSL